MTLNSGQNTDQQDDIYISVNGVKTELKLQSHDAGVAYFSDQDGKSYCIRDPRGDILEYKLLKGVKDTHITERDEQGYVYHTVTNVQGEVLRYKTLV